MDYGCRTIYAGFSPFFGLGSEEGHAENILASLLLSNMLTHSPGRTSAGARRIPISWSQIPNTTKVSDASNMPQTDIRSHLAVLKNQGPYYKPQIAGLSL